MNWKVGDIAIIYCHIAALDCANVHGKSCRLICYQGSGMCGGQYINNSWLVDVDGQDISVDEKILRKPYDGNEIVEWSSCVFQPKELVLLDKV